MNSITFAVIADVDSSTVELDQRLRISRLGGRGVPSDAGRIRNDRRKET
jgi:hypothetical protein